VREKTRPRVRPHLKIIEEKGETKRGVGESPQVGPFSRGKINTREQSEQGPPKIQT